MLDLNAPIILAVGLENRPNTLSTLAVAFIITFVLWPSGNKVTRMSPTHVAERVNDFDTAGFGI